MEDSDVMMEYPSERVESIDDLLEELEIAAKVPPKQRALKISITVDQVCANAYQYGLLDASLEKLVDIVTLPNELDQGSLGKLIKNLYPANKVQDIIAIKMVACLGHGRAKPPFPVQVALLKWLVMVYDVLENSTVLSRLYAALFNLLDTVAIRPQLCHILSLITRRKHVRPHRIQGLMELTHQAGNEPPLVGLMRVYKDYYPDVIVGDTITGRASVFTHPNQEWRQRLNEIKAVYLEKNQDDLTPGQRNFRVNHQSMNGKLGSQASVIPPLRTANAHEASTTLEEIDNAADLIGNLESIQLPNQMVAVFGDSRLQRFLQLRSSDATLKRTNKWLTAFFEDHLQSLGSETAIPVMLTAIRDYARLTKKPPSASFAYLKSMLYTWNGITGREVILELLTYLPMDPDASIVGEQTTQSPWSKLHKAIFQQLEDSLLEENTLESKIALLNFYKHLLQQWTTTLISQPPLDTSAVTDLIMHSNMLAHTILQGEDPLTISTTSSTISFYETNIALFSHQHMLTKARVIMPPAALIFTLYFSSSLNTKSRLCAMLALYKRAFETAQSLSGTPLYPKSYVNVFNGFIMDICNSIWRGRAFSTADPNSTGCLLHPVAFASLSAYVISLNIRAGDAANARPVELKELFGLSFSPLTCRMAIETVREMEDEQAEAEAINIRHAGPVTLGSLKQLGIDGGLRLDWKDYRGGVLRFMEKNGIVGVGDLMYSTVKILRAEMEKVA